MFRPYKLHEREFWSALDENIAEKLAKGDNDAAEGMKRFYKDHPGMAGVVGLLADDRVRPEDVDFSTFDGLCWAVLIVKKPEYKSRCDYEKFTAEDWVDYLVLHPQDSGLCDFSAFSSINWLLLLGMQPELMPKAADLINQGELGIVDAVLLIETIPELADAIDFDKLDSVAASLILVRHPEYADRFDFDKFNDCELDMLINENPALKPIVEPHIAFERSELQRHCTALHDEHVTEGKKNGRIWRWRWSDTPDGVTICGLDDKFHDKNEITDLDVPEIVGGKPVTAIGASAFNHFNKLRRVRLPNSIRKIGNNAFWECASMCEIELPKGLTTIESEAFSGCGLETLSIPNSVKTILWGAFANCTRLKAVDVEKGNDSFCSEDGVLYDATGTEVLCCPAGKTDVALRNGVIKIYAEAFAGCSALCEVSLPDSLREICFDAFDGCSSLKSLNIPGSVCTIWASSFGNCSALQEFTLSGGNESFSVFDGAMYNKAKRKLIACPGGKASITFPSGVREMASRAFKGCTRLRTVHVPEGVETLEDGMFYGCAALTEVSLPNSLRKINPNAFWGCSALAHVELPPRVEDVAAGCFTNTGIAELTFPKSLKSLSKVAFWCCEKLTKVTFEGDAPDIVGPLFCYPDSLYGNVSEELTTFVPFGSSGWDVDSDGLWQGRKLVRYKRKGFFARLCAMLRE